MLPFGNRERLLLYGAATLSGFLLLFGSTDASPFDILAAGVAGSTLLYLLFARPSLLLLLSWHNLALGGFTALLLLQWRFAPGTSLLFALTSLYLIGVYLLVQFWSQRHPELPSFLMRGYVLGAAVSSLLGLAAYLNAVLQDHVSDLRFFWEDNIRISVLFDDPVVYGAFLVPPLLFVSVMAATATSRRTYLLCLSLASLLFCNLIVTGSRGAWLNFLVAGAVMLFLYPPLHARRALFRIAGGGLLALALALMLIFVIPLGERSFYEATLEHRFASSDGPRIENLETAPNRLLQRDTAEIVLGSGSGSYEQTTARGFSAHNTYLRVLYEQGVVGLILYALFLFLIVRTSLRRRREQPLLAGLLVAVLAGILVQNLFVDTLHWRHFWVLVGLII